MAKVVKQEVKPVVTHEYIVTLNEEEFTLLAKLVGNLINPDNIAENLWENVFKQVRGSKVYNSINLKGNLRL